MPIEPPVVGILLAAGIGRRFDPTGSRLKLIEPAPGGPHAGVPLAVAALRNLRAVTTDVVAVVRAADSTAQHQLHQLLAAEGAQLAVCPDAAAGMGHSLACGVRSRIDATGWVIALADMPGIAPATIAAVRDAIAHGHEAAAPVHHGRRGHPVGFGRVCREELLALTRDTGARGVFDRHSPLLIDVEDPGCLLDIDTPGAQCLQSLTE
jgi:molybdenum cofactor cytidylyltransferase